MATSLTEISNIFNLMCQIDTRINSYHYGWRSDINKNIANNFDPNFSTGRMFPAVHMDKPDGITGIEEPGYLGGDESVEMLLYFDTEQDYNNDGTANTLNLIEQEDELKVIANDFIANFVVIIGADKYNIGNITKPKYVQRSNVHNQKLITWEVSFVLTHSALCTLPQYQIDLSLLPDTIPDTDIERGTSTVDACLALLASLSEEQRNECLLPTYVFSDTTVQVNVTGQQQTDLTDWLCTTPSIDQYSMSYNGVNQFLQVVSYPEFNFGNTDPFTLEIWIKPVSYASTRTILEKRVLFGNFTGVGLFHTSGVLRFLMRGTGTDFIEVKTVETQTDNVWSHVLIKVDGSSTAAGVEIWVNNVQQTPDVMSDNLTTSTANTEPLKIGGTSAGYLNGNIGYCRFWDTFLSVSNGTAQYNGGKMLDVPALPLNNVFSNRSGVGAVKSTTWVFPDQAEVAIDPAVFSNNMVFSNITTDVPT